MLYRVLDRLSMPNGRMIEPGALDPLGGLSQRVIDALQEKGRIAPVAAPPLEALDGWEGRVGPLAAVGVLDLADLLAASQAEIARAAGISLQEVEDWRDEARRLLIVGQP